MSNTVGAVIVGLFLAGLVGSILFTVSRTHEEPAEIEEDDYET